MKEKFKNNLNSLFKSTINNRTLFERRKNSFIAPLIIFILAIFMMSVPSYLFSINVSKDKVIKNFPDINEPISELLTSSLDCRVINSKLVCSETAEQINLVIGEKTKYTVIANQSTISTDTTVTYNNPKDTDNLVILLSQYIKIRYCVRDHINQKVNTYEIIGDYSKFEGFDFKEIAQTLSSSPELIDAESSNFVYNAYLSTLDTKLIVNISSALTSFLLFVIVASIILKGTTLFKRRKGFKFSECLKISITSSLPALILGTVFYFLIGIDFAMSYGFIYLIRIVFIYVKYILSTKNNIYVELYNETNEERFKI